MRVKPVILVSAVLISGAVVLATIAATRGQPPSAPVAATSVDTARVQLAISGMTCGSCATTARIALERSSGVFAARVSYDAASATVQYDASITSPAAIVARLTQQTGYRATIAAATGR